MMTQKDELEKERHLNMMVPEFIEGIGRVADRLSLPPFYEHMAGVPDEISSMGGDMTISTRKNVYFKLPLYVKIETLIMYMIKAVFKKDYFDKVEAKNSKFHYSQKMAVKKTNFVAVDAKYQQSLKIPLGMQITINENEDEF